MKPVTDPEILKQLEGGMKPVTDPDILAQLEQPEGSEGGLMGDIYSGAKSLVTGEGRKEDYPELPSYLSPQLAKTPGGSLNILRKKFPGAQLDFDEYGNPVVNIGEDYAGPRLFEGLDFPRGVEKGKDYYINKPGASWADVNLAKNVLKQAVPAAITSATLAPAGAVTAMAGTGIAGATGEALRQREAEQAGAGEGYNVEDMLTMGGYTAAGEGFGRLLAAGIGATANIIRRMAGKKLPASNYVNPDGSFTDEAINVLRQNEIDPTDLQPMLRKELGKKGVFSANEAERYNVAVKGGMKPTRAQVTQKATDFQRQQEAAKKSGLIREALEEQDQALIKQTEGIAPGKETIDPGDTGNMLTQHIVSRRTKADKAITDLYKKADELASQAKGINLNKLATWTKTNIGKDRVSGGVYSSIKSDLSRHGLIDSAGNPTGKKVTAEVAEDLRKSLNAIFDPKMSSSGKMAIHEAKDIIDDSVFSAAGKDFYKEARSVKHTMEKGMRPPGRKYEKIYKSTVTDILEGKLQPEDVVTRVISKTGKVREISHLKKFLLETNEGTQSWNNIRGEVIENMLNAATKQKGETGPVFSGPMFFKEINKLGRNKLKVIFSPEEIAALDKVTMLGQMRVPIAGTALGEGPTAQAVINAAARSGVTQKIPGLNLIMDLIESRAMKKAAGEAIQPAATTVKALTKPKRLPISPFTAGAASTEK